MKTLVFLFAGNAGGHAFEKVFAGQSAAERALIWASSVPSEEGRADVTVAVCRENAAEVRGLLDKSGMQGARTVTDGPWTVRKLLEAMCAAARDNGAGRVVFSSLDCPFLDTELTERLLLDHEKYLAEYTFAEGWPLGFAPQILDSGTLNILSGLSSGRFAAEGDAPADSQCIFNLMKCDLNSFEIETVLAPKDFRMLRLDFSCADKSSLLACENLFSLALDTRTPFTATELSVLAERSPSVQCTVPRFYNVQIARNVCSLSVYNPYPEAARMRYGESVQSFSGSPCMGLEAFNALVSEAASFSGEGTVVSLSAWGEPLLVKNLAQYVASVLSHRELSVLIETDGILLTEETAEAVRDAQRNGMGGTVTWIVHTDAVTEETYSILHPASGSEPSGGATPCLKAALSAVSVLQKYFPGSVYPQMTRMNANEHELEPFYRFWHEKTSPSGGKFIIQKYDSFCGILPDEKPADLSPLVRMPCWHLKRDMTVLWDGSVPFCRERILDGGAGNVFNDGIESVWNGIRKKAGSHVLGSDPDEKCRNCDEYYTFNF